MFTNLPVDLNSEVEKFLSNVVAWAETVPDLTAVALVGSQARGDTNPDSDIDLVLLFEEPDKFLKERSWISLFGELHRIEEEDWGKVTSLRAFYADGLEVEFGVTGLDWASAPTEQGDILVIQEGIVVLYEIDRHLSDKVKQFNVHH